MASDPFHLLIYAKDKADVPIEYTRVGSHVILPYDEEKMMDPPEVAPSCVLCFSSRGGMSSIEIAQTLRMSMPSLPMFYIALEPNEFDKKGLIKNGFSNAFLLPWENSELASAMKEQMLYSSVPEMKDYRPVKIVDLIPETVLSFGTRIYLPSNQKFVTFGREGEEIGAEKLSKLHDRGQNTLFVHKDDLDKFHAYTVEAFKAAGRAGISATEKEARLKNGIRELVSEMFVQDAQTSTFGRSNALMQELIEVVKTLISEDSPGLLAKIEQMINQESDFYGHLSRVATYATIFAMALDIEKPAEIGLAGLLHDIGLTALPPTLIGRKPEELTPEALEAYNKHPQFSVDIIKMKRMVVSDRIQRAILQHHERLDGTGTPNQLNGRKVTIEAQVVAVANEFDHLTTMEVGRAKMMPFQAFDFMIQKNGADPVRAAVDIDLLKRLKSAYAQGVKSNGE